MSAFLPNVNFLLNYATLFVAAAAFLALLLLLLWGRKRFSCRSKVLLAVVLAFLALYLAFVLWIVLATAGPPHTAPIRTAS